MHPQLRGSTLSVIKLIIVEAHGDVAHAPLGQWSDTVQTHPQWYAEAIS